MLRISRILHTRRNTYRICVVYVLLTNLILPVVKPYILTHARRLCVPDIRAVEEGDEVSPGVSTTDRWF